MAAAAGRRPRPVTRGAGDMRPAFTRWRRDNPDPCSRARDGSLVGRRRAPTGSLSLRLRPRKELDLAAGLRLNMPEGPCRGCLQRVRRSGRMSSDPVIAQTLAHLQTRTRSSHSCGGSPEPAAGSPPSTWTPPAPSSTTPTPRRHERSSRHGPTTSPAAASHDPCTARSARPDSTMRPSRCTPLRSPPTSSGRAAGGAFMTASMCSWSPAPSPTKALELMVLRWTQKLAASQPVLERLPLLF